MKDYNLKTFNTLLEFIEKFETFKIKDDVSKDRINHIYKETSTINLRQYINKTTKNIETIKTNTQVSIILLSVILIVLVIMSIILKV